jgi:hypothetical protein
MAATARGHAMTGLAVRAAVARNRFVPRINRSHDGVTVETVQVGDAAQAVAADRAMRDVVTGIDCHGQFDASRQRGESFLGLDVQLPQHAVRVVVEIQRIFPSAGRIDGVQP